MKLDLNFNPLGFYRISNDYTFDYPTNIIKHINSFYIGITSSSSNICKLFKLNSSFLKTDSLQFTSVNNPSTIEEIRFSGSNIIVNGNNIETAGVAKITLDTSLNILDVYQLNNISTYTLGQCSGTISVYPNWPKIIPISDYKEFVTGHSYMANSPIPLCDFEYGIVNAILTNSNQVLAYNLKKTPNKTVTYMDKTNYLDYKYNNVVTVGNIGHNYQSSKLLQGQPTQIYVNRTDTSGNIIWEKVYGGDMYYRPMSIVLSSDSGCMISGIRYDSANTAYPDVGESFLLKLDKNGNNLLSGIRENDSALLKYHKCFPSPANDYVCFDVPKEDNYEVNIYNLTGELVKYIGSYKNKLPLNILDLEFGIYSYVLKSDGYSVAGKFGIYIH
jgi:hypothetical protein